MMYLFSLSDDLILNKKKVTDIIPELLGQWRSKVGDAATMEKLIQALEKVNFKVAADELRNKYNTKTQEVRNKFKIRFFGETTPLEFLLQFKPIGYNNIIGESDRLIVDSIITQVRFLLKLDALQLTNLYLDSTSQTQGFLMLLDIVEIQENLKPGSIELTMDLLIKLIKGLAKYIR